MTSTATFTDSTSSGVNVLRPIRGVTFQSPSEIIPYDTLPNSALHIPVPSVTSASDSDDESSGNGSESPSSPTPLKSSTCRNGRRRPNGTSRELTNVRNLYLEPATESRIERWTREIGTLQRKAMRATTGPPPAPPPPPDVARVSSVPAITVSAERLEDQLQEWHRARQERAILKGEGSPGPNGTPKASSRPLVVPSTSITQEDDDDEVPLGMANKSIAQLTYDDETPLGLVTKKEEPKPSSSDVDSSTPSDDSVPLAARAATMSKLTGKSSDAPTDADDDDVPLALVSHAEVKRRPSKTPSEETRAMACPVTMNKLTGIHEQTEDDDEVPLALSLQAKAMTLGRNGAPTSRRPMDIPVRNPGVVRPAAVDDSDDDVPLAAIANQTLQATNSRQPL